MMAEEQQQPNTPLMNRVNNLKAMALMNKVHDIIPPQSHNEENPINFVESLKAEQHVIKAILQLKGYFFDPLTRKWASYRTPVMNEQGIGNFIATITSIAETIEYSWIAEEDIPKFVIYLFSANYPYFTVYYNEYELRREDFNVVATVLFNFILSSFHKAKGGKYINTLGRTYSEDLLGKMIGDPQKKKGGFLGGLESFNPFAKKNKET